MYDKSKQSVLKKQTSVQENCTPVNFSFLNRDRNPRFEDGLKTLPLRSCLIRHNSEISYWEVKTEPRWFTYLNYDLINKATGELMEEGKVYITNDFKKSNSSKIKRLDKFCLHYQPLYEKREVSLTFHTFTRANMANITMSRMLDTVNYRYEECLNRKLRGYIWTLEVSQRLHAHYHLCVAVDRFTVSRLPDELKFEDVWGQRTGCEFVRKNVRHYMAKYFSKHNARVVGLRSFGSSKNFF